MNDEEETGGVTWSKFAGGILHYDADRVSDFSRPCATYSGEWFALMSPAVFRKTKQLRKQVRYKRKNRNT